MATVPPGARTRTRPGPRSRGFTLIELLVGLGIVAVLATVSVPAYDAYVERTRIKTAIYEIRQLEDIIQAYELQWEVFPPNLAAVDAEDMRDPWGSPYVYLRIQGSSVNPGQLRKDKFLNPLNSDFDLYSKGPDRDSKLALTPPVSHDDVVRANNGGFIGVAEDF